MFGIGTRSKEMMTMPRGFKAVLFVCGLGILSEPTSLAKFGRENTYSFVRAPERKGFQD